MGRAVRVYVGFQDREHKLVLAVNQSTDASVGDECLIRVTEDGRAKTSQGLEEVVRLQHFTV